MYAVAYLLTRVGAANGPELYSALAALASIGDTRAVAPLIKIVVDGKDPMSRRFAVRALGYIASPDSLPAIEAAGHDRSPPVRREMVLALERMKSRGSIPAIIERLADGSVVTRAEAARILGEWEAEEASDAMVAALAKEETPEVQTALVIALSRAGDEKALDGMLQFLTRLLEAPPQRRDQFLINETTDAANTLRTRLPGGGR